MPDQEGATIYAGAMTLQKYLVRGHDEEPSGDVPSFISPGWLRRPNDDGLPEAGPAAMRTSRGWGRA